MLPLVCRGLVWTAEKLVPASARDEWHDEYSGQLWQWTLDAAIAGTGDSRFALKAHTRRAVRSALRVAQSADAALPRAEIARHAELHFALSVTFTEADTGTYLSQAIHGFGLLQC